MFPESLETFLYGFLQGNPGISVHLLKTIFEYRFQSTIQLLEPFPNTVSPESLFKVLILQFSLMLCHISSTHIQYSEFSITHVPQVLSIYLLVSIFYPWRLLVFVSNHKSRIVPSHTLHTNHM